MTFLTKKLTNGSKLSVRVMSKQASPIPPDSFSTFGHLLKFLRRRAGLTQREVAIAVGYSEAQISRLEQNQRLPDLAALTALFLPALYVEDEPEIVSRLLELAAQARGEDLPPDGAVTFSRSVRKQILEEVRSVEENVPNNLPLSLTSFVGRQRQIAELKDLLGKAKLITLIGSGGCGKTRLALEAARQFGRSYRDGIWLVDLSSISDPNLVLPAVMSTLGIPEPRETYPIKTLINHLQAKQTLLVLDNCEQIVGAAAQLAEETLRACAHVQILATSREILSIVGEVQFRVPSLSLLSDKSYSGNPPEAVQLFAERAQSVSPSFVLTDQALPAVSEICRLVDGLPLGIELAAAKISILTVTQIAARLHDSFQLLGRGRDALAHHQTLEATIQWSYGLLSEAERLLMQRLSVFLGGWTLTAAEAITFDERLIPRERVLALLSQLVDKSLVTVEWQMDGEARYGMLQTLLAFARRKLHEAGGAKSMRARHFDYFFSLTQEASLFGEEKGSWLDRLEAEHDNIRSALAWSLESGVPEQGAALILPILDFYWYRGFSGEARDWMDKFLESQAPASRARALLLQKAGWLTRAGGDFERADVLLNRALEMARETGDQNRAAWALMDLGLSARDQGDPQRAISFFLQALTFAKESGENRAVGVCLYDLAESYTLAANLNTARNLWEQGLALFRAEGDKAHIAWGLEGLAGTAYLAQNYAEALDFHLESLKCKADVMDKLGLAYSLEGLAQVTAAMKPSKRAAVLWGAANDLRESMNVPLEPSRENMYTSLIPMTRSQIGEEAFDQAWKKGKDMTVQEAIEFALDLPDRGS